MPSANITGLSVGNYDVRVRSVFSNGQLSAWLYGTVTAALFLRNPANVNDFRIAVTGDVALLQWTTLDDATVAFYQMRFSPEISGVTWETATILRSGLTGDSAQVGAVRGTYLIKAIGFSGLTSIDPAIIINTIDGLTSFNAVSVVTDATWAGDKDRVYASGGKLRLDYDGDFFSSADFFSLSDFFFLGSGLQPEGFYYLGEKVDLLDVYTSRLSVALSAYGELATDDVFMRPDFFGTTNFFSDISGDWDVELQMSTTNDDPASGGAAWSDWRTFVAGDAIARGFRFALRLSSDRRDVTPVVQSVSIKVDMPDRILSGRISRSGRVATRLPFRRPTRCCKDFRLQRRGWRPAIITNSLQNRTQVFRSSFAMHPAHRSPVCSIMWPRDTAF